jgi:hypothetical protein
MAYLGRQPIIGNYQVLDALTASATATYALTKDSVAVFPQTPANCIVSLNGVIQAPFDSYTISGSNIVFASALTGSDSIDFITVLGDVLNVGTVSDGTIGLAKLSATGTKDATTFLRGDNTFAEAGITMADQFRLTSDFSFNTSGADITSNLSRVNTTGQGTLGTGMTESSGIFSFPSTGIYKVEATLNFYANGNSPTWVYSIIKATTDNSSYTNLAGVYHGQTGTGNYWSSYNSTLVDVTDTSNVKVKFHVDTEAGTIQLYGQSTINSTFFTFTRLGDT